jgi:hypothetical protein
VKRAIASIAALLALAALAGPTAAVAQDRQLVPLKVDLVVSRNSGEKKVSSLPYSLWVTANDTRNRTSLRMGVQVPVASTRVPEKDAPPPPAFTYRDVGTNIDCTAQTVADGRFNVQIMVNDSSIQFDAKDSKAVPGLPTFRNFQSSFALLLRDGQTATYTSATDPLSGETLKVDVTLTVLK